MTSRSNENICCLNVRHFSAANYRLHLLITIFVRKQYTSRLYRIFALSSLSHLAFCAAVFFGVRLLAASRFAGIATGVFHCNN